MQLTSQQYGSVITRLREVAASSGSDKRKLTRMEVQARIEVGTVVDGAIVSRIGVMTRDVSLGGIGFLSSQPCEASTQLFIELPETASRVLHLRAIVMHCRGIASGIFSLGAHFDALADPALVAQWRDVTAITQRRIQQSILG